jgi:hypothetical protein
MQWIRVRTLIAPISQRIPKKFSFGCPLIAAGAELVTLIFMFGAVQIRAAIR